MQFTISLEDVLCLNVDKNRNVDLLNVYFGKMIYCTNEKEKGNYKDKFN